jgi:preprotein translocase subunit SecF
LIITAIWSQLWGVEITLDVVAALMVLLGFSVNDTIVIFDRIRENSRADRTMTFTEICNRSINQSLARTVITSGTAIMAAVAMLFFGGEGLAAFAKVLLIGFFVGTYSTAFLATPIVFAWNKIKDDRLLKALSAKKVVGPEEAKAPKTDTRIGRAPKRRTV